jgi:hypothetical protein
VLTRQGLLGWPGSPGLVRVLLEVCAAQPELMSANRAGLLGLYTDKVLGARERPSPETLAAYQPLLATLTDEELGGGLLATATRMMKRFDPGPLHQPPTPAFCSFHLAKSQSFILNHFYLHDSLHGQKVDGRGKITVDTSVLLAFGDKKAKKNCSKKGVELHDN